MYLYGLSFGIGLAATAIVLLLCRCFNSIALRTNSFWEKLKRSKFYPVKQKSNKKEVAIYMTAAAVGSFVMLVLSWGTPYVGTTVGFGAGAGVALAKAITKTIENAATYKKRKDVATLFEAVETYMATGLSIPQSLNYSKLLAPSIKSAVEKCVREWPFGALKALENFRREVGVPEADILVSLLSQIERKGDRNLEGVFQREVSNMERLRAVKERSKIVFGKPMYFVVYRAIPALCTFGVVIGALVYRLNHTFKSAGIF
ncbi:MAG TPA: hypothetical protein PK728_04960 [Bacillota bacterium]|nr:hypothetical protein [Bacillota bacterium]